jgi:hypothetical protein
VDVLEEKVYFSLERPPKMDFKKTESIYNYFRKSPKKAFCFLLLSLAVIVLYAYITGFFGEKGKQLATPSTQTFPVAQSLGKEDQETKNTQPHSGTPNPALPSSKEQQTEKTKQGADKTDPAPRIYQRTKGDQSPAIVSDRDVTITYGEPKKTKESKQD